MKTFKTSMDKRSTFTYIDATGKTYTLEAGQVDIATGRVLTEEDIKRLHRMDDNEVYNNVKNSRVPVQRWEKPILEAWKKEHPDMNLPTRKHVSLDDAGEDGDGGEADVDKGFIAKASLAAAARAEDPMIDRLHEVVEMLRPDQQELYRRIMINEEAMVDVADELGLDASAIRHRMKTIREFIKKNF